MSIFVTGTDTNVGKTITCGLLLKKYYKIYPKIRYWKPIQTGYPPDDDTEVVHNISFLPKEYSLENIKFKLSVSPHLASEFENKVIDIDQLKKDFKKYSKTYSLIIEGAGGILVPLTRNYFWIDWIADLQLPVLVVARSTLGTINHTLLTIEVLKYRKLKTIGIIFCGKQEEEYIKDNRKIIQDISQLPVISYFDFTKEKDIDPDPNFILQPYLS
ncbi:MAG: dethiobiotin synthase [Leptonema sp. (in: bacteria)]